MDDVRCRDERIRVEKRELAGKLVLGMQVTDASRRFSQVEVVTKDTGRSAMLP